MDDLKTRVVTNIQGFYDLVGFLISKIKILGAILIMLLIGLSVYTQNNPSSIIIIDQASNLRLQSGVMHVIQIFCIFNLITIIYGSVYFRIVFKLYDIIHAPNYKQIVVGRISIVEFFGYVSTLFPKVFIHPINRMNYIGRACIVLMLHIFFISTNWIDYIQFTRADLVLSLISLTIVILVNSVELEEAFYSGKKADEAKSRLDKNKEESAKRN